MLIRNIRLALKCMSKSINYSRKSLAALTLEARTIFLQDAIFSYRNKIKYLSLPPLSNIRG